MIDYTATVLTGVAILGIQALGLNIQWGWAGMLNLSFVAWVAVGAYTTALVTLPSGTAYEPHWLGLGQPFVVGLLASIIVAAVLSTIFGAIALRRLRSDYFAIVTLVVGEIFATWANSNISFANGAGGLASIPQPFLSFIPYSEWDYFMLGFSLLVLGIVMVFCMRLQRSPFGRALRAVRDDQTAAQAFGRSALSFKLRAFVIGSVLAAIGGSMTAAYIGAWAPSAFTASETLLLLTAIVLGGTGNNWGALVGVTFALGIYNFVVGYIPDLSGGANQELLQNLRLLVFGLLTLAVLYWRPRGAIPEPLFKDQEAPRRKGWSRRGSAATPNELGVTTEQQSLAPDNMGSGPRAEHGA